MYGSISNLGKKTKNEILKIISPEKLLKLFVNKDANKDSLSFQLYRHKLGITIAKR